MKVAINNNWNDRFDININELFNFSIIIHELKKINHYMCGYILIYENIILNDKEKLLKFYGICENDEIWFGPIENYLKDDKVIIELFVLTIEGDIIYVIVKKSESISNLKLITNKIIQTIFNIYDIKGFKLNDDIIIVNIDFVDENYKLIIVLESECDVFNKYCKLRDEYLISRLFLYFTDFNFKDYFEEEISIVIFLKYVMLEWIQDLLHRKKISILENLHLFDWYKNLSSSDYWNAFDKWCEIGIEAWKREICKAKQIIISNQNFDYKLSGVFMNSRFLFWINICDIIDELLINLISKNDKWQLMQLILRVSMMNYIVNKHSQSNIIDASMRNIL